MEKQVKTKRLLPNKTIYIGFLVVAILFICKKDYATAILYGGLGLAFDPFNQSVPFHKRPVWQRIWLMVHCVFVLVVLWLSVIH